MQLTTQTRFLPTLKNKFNVFNKHISSVCLGKPCQHVGSCLPISRRRMRFIHLRAFHMLKTLVKICSCIALDNTDNMAVIF